MAGHQRLRRRALGGEWEQADLAPSVIQEGQQCRPAELQKPLLQQQPRFDGGLARIALCATRGTALGALAAAQRLVHPLVEPQLQRRRHRHGVWRQRRRGICIKRR